MNRDPTTYDSPNNEEEIEQSGIPNDLIKFSETITMNYKERRRCEDFMEILVKKNKNTIKDFMELFKWEGKIISTTYIFFTCLNTVVF